MFGGWRLVVRANQPARSIRTGRSKIQDVTLRLQQTSGLKYRTFAGEASYYLSGIFTVILTPLQAAKKTFQ